MDRKLKVGVSGIMRVKNDARFIEASVKSCIDALDELVIVWNDCSDDSEEVIMKMCELYPQKVRAYEYKYKVYSINLTKEEYEYVKLLPLDSPHLLCNFYNFGLSKVCYQYAMKIDADQIYFTDKLKDWCDVYRKGVISLGINGVVGSLVWVYMKLVNRINLTSTRCIYLIPKLKDNSFLRKAYIQYVKHKASQGSPVSLSGVDVIKHEKWYVTLGKKNHIMNILPPYNGVGDHLIFKVTDNTYYRPDDCKFYNELRSDKYSLIEWFEHDGGREYPIGIYWFHINAMRSNVYGKIQEAIIKYPKSIMELSAFAKADYNSTIYPLVDKAMMVQYQNNLFQFIHQFDSIDIINNICIIENILI